ncbi:DNA gyrase inhibitor YacG [Bryobacter aggregatus]|uniref:DNA gyrase inhibitor YacG n=1 Tax=Bryobacter aggregatus TaxID=360054 RepID=UPI0004E268BD|nr:DNA gyrase inhibitor YacG [Bryobacter aggregatus]
MPIQAKCPICRKVTTHGDEYFPFCSKQCQDIDLGKWANEEYKIPGPPVQLVQEDEDDEIRDR